MKINHPKHTPPPDPLENMSRGNKRKRAQVNQCGKVDGKKPTRLGGIPYGGMQKSMLRKRDYSKHS